MRFTGSELLLYGGIAAMAAAVIATVTGIVVFVLSGHRLKEQLEKEYGKPSISQK